MISYEFPITERIRTLLRLEDLYDRVSYFLDSESPLDHQGALLVMFEIMEVAGRADLKSDLIQELERQRISLDALRNNPQISEEALNRVLSDIENTHGRLLESTGKFAQHLRENEWLMAIKQRANIPGGICEFDLPSYHFWLQQPAQTRLLSLQRWLKPMLPIKQGVEIVLRLLRDSAKSFQYVAKAGMFQQMSGGKQVQLLKVSVPTDLQYVPELSANKYAINVRFVQPVQGSERAKQCEHDIEFVLAYCTL